VTTPADEDDAPSRRRFSPRSSWHELPFLIIIALVLALIIKTFLVQAFYIPSASMENTLQGGNPLCNTCGTSPGHPFDRILVNKASYDVGSVHRGQIVVFRRPPGWPDESDYTVSGNPVVRFLHDVGSTIGLAPAGTSDFVKRVIGVAGDHVVCCNAANQIMVNGHALNEPYIDLATRDASQHDLAYTPFRRTVPKDDLFVMGDHRDDSEDSRAFGFVPTKYVVGRAFLVIWPVSDWKHLGVPATFGQPGLHAAGSDAVPAAASALAVVPVAGLRRRRRRRRAAARSPRTRT
jgi:signal peptidase I